MSQLFEEFQGTSRFSVVRTLGAGGMGVVYEAFDRERKETVALKTLRKLDATSLYRFKQEFRSLAEIVHPNLVQLYELFADGLAESPAKQRWFFTMELVEHARDFGAYLRPKADDGRDTSNDETTTAYPETATSSTLNTTLAMPSARGSVGAGAPGRVVQTGDDTAVDYAKLRLVLHQLVAGVQALHDAGKLHRDLKPSNVIVRPDGHVLLLDFGLVAELSAAPAREREAGDTVEHGSEPLTHSSTDRGLAGTVAYMSPEQAARAPLTAASDWYAVGGMLFFALTNRLPFSGAGLDVLSAKQERDAPRPSSVVTGIPSDLEALCVDLLKRDPSARPAGPEILARLGVTAASPAGPSAAREQGRGRLPFVGRERHLAALEAAFARTTTGETVVCHVHGRSGSGKSALVHKFLDGLTTGHRAVTLTGRCYEQESVPYKAIDSVVDALTRHVLLLRDDEAAALVPRHMPELVRIFPVLNRVDAFSRATHRKRPVTDPRQMRDLAFGALREMLSRLGARGPLVICIDDVQWGDVDSADLLAGLLRAPGAPRVLVLLTYRTEYIATSSCLQSLMRHDGIRLADATELAVDALSHDEARELALALLGDRPTASVDADWIARESAGGAFFVYALVEHLKSGAARSEAPLVLDDVLWQQVMGLPETPRRLLEVIAVAGRPVALQHAQNAAHLSNVPTQVVAGLRAGHLIRTMGTGLLDRVETFHDRIRESIVARLAPDALRHHHAGLAASLEMAGDADPETLAIHLEGSGQPGRASGLFEKAAGAAAEVLAFERAEALYRKAAALAADAGERARIHERMIHFYTDLARFSDAYAVAREAVVPFGVTLPAKFVPPLLIADFLASKFRLRGRKTASLIDLPVATDQRLITAVRLMNAVAKAAYQIRPELCVAVSTKIVNMCLAHGNTPDCAIGYMVYGAIFQGGVMGRHRTGYEFGQLALSLVDRYRNEQQRAEVNFVVGYFGTSWLKPSAVAEGLWRTAYEAGLRTGDLFHTGCASAASIMSAHMRGVPFAENATEANRLLEELQRHQLREPIGAITAVRQAELNLQGATRDRTTFSGDAVDEAALAAEIGAFGSRHFAHFYFIVKTESLYLWDQYDAARAMAERSAAYLKDSPGMLHSADHHFYSGLAHAADGGSHRRARAAASKFKRWAVECPDNFLHKERVLAGEVARLAGKTAAALSCYAEAESAAAKFGYVQIEALAARLAARLLTTMSRQAEAADAAARAAAAYRRWGAHALADK